MKHEVEFKKKSIMLAPTQFCFLCHSLSLGVVLFFHYIMCQDNHGIQQFIYVTDSDKKDRTHRSGREK